MKYFTIEELCQSETAEALEIDNTPTEEVKENLTFFTEKMLDPLRESWGSAIIVNSGYRCPELNKAVGGSETSVHPLGWGVDLWPKNGKIEEFKKHIIKFFKGKRWDQVILEKSGKKVWVHIGLYNRAGKQRCQIFKLEN